MTHKNLELKGIYTTACPKCGYPPTHLTAHQPQPEILPPLITINRVIYQLGPCGHYIDGFEYQMPANQVASDFLIVWHG